jgi:hypothetical protein
MVTAFRFFGERDRKIFEAMRHNMKLNYYKRILAAVLLMSFWRIPLYAEPPTMPPGNSGGNGTRQYSEYEIDTLIDDLTAAAEEAIEQAAAEAARAAMLASLDREMAAVRETRRLLEEKRSPAAKPGKGGGHNRGRLLFRGPRGGYRRYGDYTGGNEMRGRLRVKGMVTVRVLDRDGNVKRRPQTWFRRLLRLPGRPMEQKFHNIVTREGDALIADAVDKPYKNESYQFSRVYSGGYGLDGER